MRRIKGSNPRTGGKVSCDSLEKWQVLSIFSDLRNHVSKFYFYCSHESERQASRIFDGLFAFPIDLIMNPQGQLPHPTEVLDALLSLANAPNQRCVPPLEAPGVTPSIVRGEARIEWIQTTTLLMNPAILKRYHITGPTSAQQIALDGRMKASTQGLLGPGVYCGPIETVAKHSFHKDEFVIALVPDSKIVPKCAWRKECGFEFCYPEEAVQIVGIGKYVRTSTAPNQRGPRFRQLQAIKAKMTPLDVAGLMRNQIAREDARRPRHEQFKQSHQRYSKGREERRALETIAKRLGLPTRAKANSGQPMTVSMLRQRTGTVGMGLEELCAFAYDTN